MLENLFPANDFSLIAVILAMPLLGAFVNGIWGKRLGKLAVRAMALSAMGISFCAALLTFAALYREAHHPGASAEGHDFEYAKLVWAAWDWMHTSGGRDAINVPIEVKFSVDALSGVMMLVVTGVGFLIHLYAATYMEHEPKGGFARFFAYMNLFVFSMLVLILGDNLPILFVGWEGVGLCSYLLIGFWFENPANASAGKKAFIANRIGDFGLLCAMFLLAHYTGALDWQGISNGANSLATTTSQQGVHVWPIGGGQYTGFLSFLQPKSPVVITGATAVGLALLLGCTGKSAQLPLYVWLPDAMAGPTPVSALIHAATMVTAGIYLVCRMAAVFVLSPFVMMVIAVIGATTALLAATIALVQFDIKKVLAYSTVSQLGFMFLGVGVGAFADGFFHVFTHAFFKACLFLGAGSVIHSMHARIHDDVRSQDIRSMGGLSKFMPITFWTFAASTAAIIGFPLTSGFFSKDEILYKAFTNRALHPMREAYAKKGIEFFEPPTWLGPALYAAAVLAATLTAFYMCRLFFLTFFGTFRGWAVGRASMTSERPKGHGHDGGHHDDLSRPGRPPHESPWPMTVPLIILGTAAVFAGVLNMGLFHKEALGQWLEPVFEGAQKAAIVSTDPEHHKVWLLAAGGFGAFAVGSGLAFWIYMVKNGEPARQLAAATGPLYRLIVDKWRVDELYDATAIAAVESLAETSTAVDKYVVDGILARASSAIVVGLGTLLRAFQTGVVHVYAAIMVVGLAGVAWFAVAPHPAVTIRESSGDYVLEAAPGIAYEFRWDADGNGQPDEPKFGSTTQVKVHLEPGGAQVVRLEVMNAFGLVGAKEIHLAREKPKDSSNAMKLGQN